MPKNSCGALDIDPSLYWAQVRPGGCGSLAGNFDVAREHIRQAAGNAPTASERAEVTGFLAGWLGEAGFPDEAMARTEGALALDPRCTGAWLLQGRILLRDINPQRDQNSVRALSCYARAYPLDPENPEALYRLGDILACEDDHLTRAHELLAKAVALKPAFDRARRRDQVRADLDA